MHGRASNLRLDVVPGRPTSIEPRREVHRLRVAGVVVVVAAAQPEVDAADEGDVVVRAAGVPDDDKLLVVTAGPPRTRVQHDVAAVRRYDGPARRWPLRSLEPLRV